MGKLKQKEDFVEKMAEEIKSSKAVYLAECIGVDSNTTNSFRQKCRESGIHYFISKNTLSKHAFEKAGIESFNADLKGPTSIGIAKDDPMSPAKVFAGFAKETDNKFKVKSCYIDGVFYGAADVAKLATIPTKEVLLSQLLSVLNAPMRNMAGALSGILRNVAGVIDAVAKQKS